MYRAHILNTLFPFDLNDVDIKKMLIRNKINIHKDNLYHFMYGDFKDLVSCIALMYNDNIWLAKDIITSIREVN